MRILFDINHPAHVHLFRNAIRILRKRGHEILVLARQRGLIAYLLSVYGIDFIPTTKQRYGAGGLIRELVENDTILFHKARRFAPDLLVGSSVGCAHIGRFVGGKSVIFDDDGLAARSFVLLAYPFAHTICSPDAMAWSWGKKHVKYPSYHELAYLHPNLFTPDSSVLSEYGLESGEPYFLLRIVRLEAFHDITARGIGSAMWNEIVRILRHHGRILVSAEDQKEKNIPHTQTIRSFPEHIHSLMYYATLVVSDSQTMTAESAVLGTPNIRCNTFRHRIPYLRELEQAFRLTYAFTPEQGALVLEKIEEMLAFSNLKEEWKKRRMSMLNRKINLTRWMVGFLESM